MRLSLEVRTARLLPTRILARYRGWGTLRVMNDGTFERVYIPAVVDLGLEKETLNKIRVR